MRSDVDFLGLTAGDGAGRFRFGVRDHLTRMDGHLYGGTAIAVSIATAEDVSGRPPVWMTTQFVATAPPGATVEVLCEVLAPGRRTNQVRVTGTTTDGRVMFASLGATGHARPGGLSGDFEQAPAVSPPARSAPSHGPFAAMLRNAGIDLSVLDRLPEAVGFHEAVEFREPEVDEHPDPGPGRVCMWVRRRDGVVPTPAVLAFVADMVPLSVAHGAGVLAGGISLDNTIRFAAGEPTEWVLLDLRAHAATGDYGHGAAHLWNERGDLLATASQSASMFRFDPGVGPWAAEDDPPAAAS